MDQTAKLSIISRSIAALKLDPLNPRRHSKRQIRQIARSIRTFGFNVPVLINSRDEVLAGHGRIEAALTAGLDAVPVIRIEHLTETESRAFMIADNRLAETSSWDDQLLARTLSDLASLDLNFSIEATGFDTAEIDLRIEGLAGLSDAPDQADHLPAPRQTSPVSEIGDVWVLGQHRVSCGNALDAEVFRRLMLGKRAAMVFTDPPYNLQIDGHVSGLGKVRHREFAMAAGEMSSAEFIAFLTRVGANLVRNSLDGSIHFICMDWRHAGEMIAAGNANYSELKNICAWVKNNAGMGSFYRSQHELIFVFKSGRAPHRNNIQLGQFGRNRTNVWNYPGATTFSKSTDEGPLLHLHPTVKPVRLIADAILDCSARQEIVLDPFLGSGSTLIAAERTGRRCYGIEIDPLYVDVIISRWQAYTGENARHADSGRTFNEITEEAGHGE